MIKVFSKQLLCVVLGVSTVLCTSAPAVIAESDPNDPGAPPPPAFKRADSNSAPDQSKAGSEDSIDGDIAPAKTDKPVPLSMSIPGAAKYDRVLTPPSEPYVLGPGDQLNIIDYSFADADKPPLSHHTTVLPDGTATIYPLGLVMVQGTTLKQVNELANSSHGGPPEIFVTLAKPRPVAVRVLGDVVSPGIYTAEPGLFTSKVGIQQLENTGPDDGSGTGGSSSNGSMGLGYTAQNQTSTISTQVPRVNQLTLLTALQLAGGVHDTADITHIRVSRAFSGKICYVDLWNLITEGDVSQDIPIRDGDTIFVSKGGEHHDLSNIGVAAERTRRVRVIGAVKKPGVFDMRPDDDLYSAIAKAGGYTDTAVTRSIILTRKTPQGTIKTQTVHMPGRNFFGFVSDKGEAVGRLPVKNGDVVVVTESSIKKFGPKTANTVVTVFSALGLVLLNSAAMKRN